MQMNKILELLLYKYRDEDFIVKEKVKVLFTRIQVASATA
jgi:hypothetical protein